MAFDYSRKSSLPRLPPEVNLNAYLAVVTVDDKKRKYFKLAPASREGGRPASAVGLSRLATVVGIDALWIAVYPKVGVKRKVVHDLCRAS